MKAAAVVLVLSLFVLPLVSQEVSVREPQKIVYAYLECQGAYSQIPEKIGFFMQEFMKQDLPFAGSPFAIYHNSPEEVRPEELKWDIGMPVNADSDVAEPLRKCELKYKLVATAVHVGPYDQCPATYAKVFEYINANGYVVSGPVLEFYLNNPELVKPEELRTEIWIPVEKKEQ